MTNLDRILKSRDITLLTKVCIVKAVVFPVVMYSHESWIMKKVGSQRIEVFKLCCWRRLERTVEPDVMQSMGLQRVRHNLVTQQQQRNRKTKYKWKPKIESWNRKRTWKTWRNQNKVSSIVNLNMKVKVAQLCPALCDLMDYTVHGILQARILEWVAFPLSRGYSQWRDWTQVSRIAGKFLTSWAQGKPRVNLSPMISS